MVQIYNHVVPESKSGIYVLEYSCHNFRYRGRLVKDWHSAICYPKALYLQEESVAVLMIEGNMLFNTEVKLKVV